MVEGTIRSHPFDKLFPIFTDDAFGEADFAKTDVFIHLLRVFRIERAPAATHFKEKHTEGPEINDLGISMLIQ